MAVYTHIGKEELPPFIADYDIGSVISCDGIAEGVENSNYKITTERARFILTLFEKRVEADDLPFYISFMEHLHGCGIPCPAVIRRKNGDAVASLAGKPALITSFLDGAWPRDIRKDHCAKIGALLARMHIAAAGFAKTRKNSMSYAAWQKLISASAAKADTIEKGLADFLARELNEQAQRPEGLPAGVVHADLFPDNVFFNGDDLSGVIDFYFSCTETFAYDLMLTMNPWCFNRDGALDHQKSSAFLNAYHHVRPLSGDEIRSLPFFGRAAALRIIATRLYDFLHPREGAVVTAKDPLEHVRILRFHQQAAPSDYGLAA